MTCYAGSIDPSSLTLETWHSDESFYDSITGRSPLMQLCRMINLARAKLSLTDYSFHRIGTDTTDTSFAVIDYETHPTWNPLYDIKMILLDCQTACVGLFSYQTATDCYNRKYVSGTILSSYYTAVSGKSFDKKEDWQVIINALRVLLEDLETADIQTQAWTSHTVTFSWQFAVSGDPTKVNPDYIEGSGEYGMYDPAALIAGSPGYFQMRFGSTGHDEYNLFASRSVSCFPNHSTPGALSAFYVRGSGVFEGPGAPDYYYTESSGGVDYCDHGNNSGWFTRDTAKVAYRLLAISAPSGFDLSLIEGHEISWSLEPRYSLETPNISWSASATSGTFTAVISGAMNTADLEIDVSMTDANISNNWPISKSVGFRLHIVAGRTVNVCRDACGNYHLEDV